MAQLIMKYTLKTVVLPFQDKISWFLPFKVVNSFVCFSWHLICNFSSIFFYFQFCFVARKKFSQVSLLHVVHHGLMPLSVWPGARFVPGGHASFFSLLNTFVHIIMYAYYLLAAMGPRFVFVLGFEN